jgi:hypothetical protein
LFDTGCKPLSIMSSKLAANLSLIVTPTNRVLSTAKKGGKVSTFFLFRF